MTKKPQPPPVNQTAIGNDNIQVVGSNNVITRITNFFAGGTEQQHAQRNRRAMLELVKNTWIKGVLEKSLYNEVLIQLGLEERPGSVEHPWDIQVQMPNKDSRTLSPSISMMQVFDEMNGAMLILGEPGSGKTTMLLELTRECLARAQEDDNCPIPVVFNLSSWDGKHTFDDWLVKELNTKYNVPKKTAQIWVVNDELQPMLDGLDEVRQENREACVKAINDFRQNHGLTLHIAVCSRVADYEALTTQLNLQGAVLLQPLAPDQIDEYFKQAGPELEIVHQILQHDDVLQELVKQPLILSIMTLAYRKTTTVISAGEKLGTLEARREHLFDAYVQQMFERVARTRNELYTPKQSKLWLGWLAQMMSERSQSVFLLDRMQRSWFQSRTKRMFVSILVYALIAIAGFQWAGEIYQLDDGLIIGLGFGLVVGMIGELQEKPDETRKWTWKTVCRGLVLGMYFLLIERLVGSVFGEFAARPFLAFAFGFFVGAIGEIQESPTEALRWSWRRALLGMLFGIISGIVVVMLFLFIVGLGSGFLDPATYLIMGLVLGLLLGLFIGLSIILVYGLEKAELKTRSVTNQGIRQSVRYMIIFGVVFGLYGSLFVPWFIDGEYPLFFGFFFGLYAFLYFGGFAVINHYILRMLLYLNGNIPLNYIRFLDYAAERIFLRKVGGGYIFVHRLLMEHFAAMYSASEGNEQFSTTETSSP